MKLSKLSPRNNPNVPPTIDTISGTVVLGTWDVSVYFNDS